MKKIFSIFISSLLSIATHAQTFYELQYTNPDDNQKYLGLMTYYDDNNCKMRIVRAADGAKGRVWETSYTKTCTPKTRDNNMGFMIYTPEDGRSVPSLLWYWREFNTEDMASEPDIVYDTSNVEEKFAATSFKEKSLGELTTQYLSQFYKKEDAEYKSLLAAANMVNQQNKKEVTSKGPQEPTLRLLMIANTEVDDIGIACQQDLKNVTNEFRNIARVLQIPYEQTIVSNRDFNEENVAKAIDEFSPSKQDIVVFVYSGHGFRFKDQKREKDEEFPNLNLTRSVYDNASEHYSKMGDVHNAIVAKGAKLNIILSDCCNTEIRMETPSAVSTNTLFSRATCSLDTEKLRSLFLGTQGDVWATAASPGEASWCGVKGGFFLLSVIESLRYQISSLTSEKPSWDSLITSAIDRARETTNSNGVPKEQNGIKRINVKKSK